eukprot:4350716-Prymnesium_polylepis.1
MPAPALPLRRCVQKATVIWCEVVETHCSMPSPSETFLERLLSSASRLSSVSVESSSRCICADGRASGEGGGRGRVARVRGEGG